MEQCSLSRTPSSWQIYQKIIFSMQTGRIIPRNCKWNKKLGSSKFVPCGTALIIIHERLDMTCKEIRSTTVNGPEWKLDEPSQKLKGTKLARYIFKLPAQWHIQHKSCGKIEKRLWHNIYLVIHFRFYLYEHDCLLFGFYENGNWSFGIKDQGPRSSGKEVSIQLDAEMANGVTNVQVRKAEYPL